MPEVFKYLSEKLPLSQKTTLLPKGPFLITFHTIISSPLLVKIFELDLETSELDFGVLKSFPAESSQLRVTRVFFLPLLFRNFDDQLSANFHMFVTLCIC